MDTTRWKSILVPREVYEEIKELSKAEGRTLGGQLRLVFEWYKKSQEGNNGRPYPEIRTRGTTKKAK